MALAKVGVAAVSLLVLIGNAFADDSSIRQEILKKGVELFKNTVNHCESFQQLVGFSASKADGPAQLIEDLRFVLIGKSLTERGTGGLYIGKMAGERGDNGFQKALQDGSPQVEHAWAAIYLGKNYPPGSTEAAALLTEVMDPLVDDGKLNPQDILLWAIGGDIGKRLSRSNYKELPGVIKRTMCE